MWIFAVVSFLKDHLSSAPFAFESNVIVLYLLFVLRLDRSISIFIAFTYKKKGAFAHMEKMLRVYVH